MIVIQFLYSIPGIPLGYILYFIYNVICSNVGIAIIIFTFIVKVALLPLYIKQQKSTAKTAVFQPMVQEIQRKYKNNQEKQQEELMKLQQQGFKPMSGCGTMLLSFLILFGVIDVVYKPLTHIVHMSSSVSDLAEESYSVELTSVIVGEYIKTDITETEKTKHDNILRDAENILNYYNEHCLKEGDEKLDISVFDTLDAKSVKVVRNALKTAIENEYVNDASEKKKAKSIEDTDLYKITDAENSEMAELPEEERELYRLEHSFSSDLISALNNVKVHFGYYTSSGENSTTFTATSSMQRELYILDRFGSSVGGFKCRDAYTRVTSEQKNEIAELSDNLNFAGIPLGSVPKDNMGFPMILVPIISFLLAMAQTFLSQWTMKKSNPDAPPMMGPMKITMYIMPLFSLFIAFTVPAGAGFYWAISYGFGILQTLLLNKLYNPVKLREEALAQYKEMTKKASKTKKAVEAEVIKVVNADGKEETISQKELTRRRLAEARKAQAEKYGEEYHEDGD